MREKRPRPSSARWADLSSTKGMHLETIQKVEEMKKQREAEPTSDLSHIKEFKNLSTVL